MKMGDVALAAINSSARRSGCDEEPACKKSKTDPSSSFEHSIIAKTINLVLMRATTECQHIQFESTVLEQLLAIDGLSHEQKLDLQVVWWTCKRDAKDKPIDSKFRRSQEGAL
eukprot:g61284.t1